MTHSVEVGGSPVLVDGLDETVVCFSWSCKQVYEESGLSLSHHYPLVQPHSLKRNNFDYPPPFHFAFTRYFVST